MFGKRFYFYRMINRRFADVLGVLPHVPHYRVYRRPGTGRSARVSRGAHDRDRVSRTRTTRTDDNKYMPARYGIIPVRRLCSPRGDTSINRTRDVSVVLFLLSFSPRHTLRRYFNRTRSPSRLVLCYATRITPQRSTRHNTDPRRAPRRAMSGLCRSFELYSSLHPPIRPPP